MNREFFFETCYFTTKCFRKNVDFLPFVCAGSWKLSPISTLKNSKILDQSDDRKVSIFSWHMVLNMLYRYKAGWIKKFPSVYNSLAQYIRNIHKYKVWKLKMHAQTDFYFHFCFSRLQVAVSCFYSKVCLQPHK